MSIWPMQPLVNLLENGQVSYGVVQPGNDSTSGIPIVRVKDIRAGLVDTSAPMRVDEEIANRHSRTTLSGGELLLTLVGTVGEVAVAPEALRGWNVARAVAVIRSSHVSSRWLQLCFETDGVRAELDSFLNTTVQSTLNLSDLKKIQVPVPPEAEREAIAEVLGALDDKIAANTKLAETAEALSQAVFRSIIGDALSAPLSSTARFVNGKAFTKGASGTGRVVIRIAELNSGLGGSTVFSDAEVGDDFLARPGDILFAWSGSLTLHRWFRSEGIVNQHIFKVVPNGYPSWLVFELLRDRLTYFKGIAADKATTMGHIQRGHLDELVYLPSRSSIDRVHELMTSLWDRTLLAERENETLAATRDALLPQLMSGILRVRDAETFIDELV